MGGVKQLLFGVFFVLFIINTIGKPLFLNNSYITSLLGASSGSQHYFQNNPDSENIAIVTKPEKQQESPKNNDDNSFYFPTESEIDLPTTEATNLFQKKFAKLLRKIVTVAQIKQALTGNNQDSTGFMYPYTPDLDEKDIKIANEYREYGAPLRIDLARNERKDDSEIEEKNEKISPSTLGVFLFEVFASLIGLSIGTASHINNLAQNNNTI